MPAGKSYGRARNQTPARGLNGLTLANKLLWGAEERQTQNVSGTDALLTALDTYYATGGQANVNQTAAVEFALSLPARAFMMAETTPAIPALDPLTLSMLVRQTLALGNAVFQIAVNRLHRRQPPAAPCCRL